jgi:excisionase family DNA binding protein
MGRAKAVPLSADGNGPVLLFEVRFPSKQLFASRRAEAADPKPMSNCPGFWDRSAPVRPTRTTSMRTPRSSLSSFSLFEIPDQGSDALALGGAPPVYGEALAPAGSKSASDLRLLDLPTWVHPTSAPRSRISKKTTGEADVPVHAGGKVRGNDGALLDGQQTPGKRSGATARAARLQPLLTVPEAATILNVSGRTIRRLIDSGAIPAVWIGRSVRLRPRDIERMIAAGGICND